MKSIKLFISFFVLGSILTSCRNDGLSSKNLTNVSVVRETEQPANAPKESTAQPAAKENGNNFTHSVKTQGAEYHIIVGSFSYSERAKAEKLVRNLRAKEYPAILIDSKNRYRVSIENFTNPQDANAARDEYRKDTDRGDIWILKVDK